MNLNIRDLDHRARTGERARSIVFVVGLHRSGTTLLTDLIGRHDEVSGFALGSLSRMNEGQGIQSVMLGQDGRILDDIASLGLKRRNHLTERSEIATPAHAERLWSEWAPHWDLSKARLLEKSPGNLVKIRLLKCYFPNARFVLITRHPVAQAMAIAKWATNRTRLQFLANWAASHRKFRHDTRDINVLHVSYEGLCADPEGTMGSVFDHLDLPFRDVLDRELSDSNGKYFAAWQAEAEARFGGVEARVARGMFGGCARSWGYRMGTPWVA